MTLSTDKQRSATPQEHLDAVTRLLAKQRLVEDFVHRQDGDGALPQHAIGHGPDRRFAAHRLGRRSHDDQIIGGSQTEGWLDARINLKWRFYEKDTFSLALMPGVIIPTGKSGLSTERVNPGVMLIGSYEPEPLALHADIGYRYLDNVLGLREDLYHASVSVHYTLQDRLKMVADQSWESTLDPGPTGTVRYTTLGAIWRVSQSFGVGCGVKIGHGEFAIDRTYLCGMGLRLN